MYSVQLYIVEQTLKNNYNVFFYIPDNDGYIFNLEKKEPIISLRRNVSFIICENNSEWFMLPAVKCLDDDIQKALKISF